MIIKTVQRWSLVAGVTARHNPIFSPHALICEHTHTHTLMSSVLSTYKVILGLHLTSTPARRPQKNWRLKARKRQCTSGLGSISSQLGSIRGTGSFSCSGSSRLPSLTFFSLLLLLPLPWTTAKNMLINKKNAKIITSQVTNIHCNIIYNWLPNKTRGMWSPQFYLSFPLF